MDDRLFHPAVTKRHFSPVGPPLEPEYLYYSAGVPIPPENNASGSADNPIKLAHLDVYLSKKRVAAWLGNQNRNGGSYDTGSTTFFSATRYNRRTALRWPFPLFKIWGQNSGENSIAMSTWPVTRG